MRDPKYCKLFLETILGIKIRKLEYPESQKTIDLSAGAKGVRLDVYVEDENNTVFDMEMQAHFPFSCIYCYNTYTKMGFLFSGNFRMWKKALRSMVEKGDYDAR